MPCRLVIGTGPQSKLFCFKQSAHLFIMVRGLRVAASKLRCEMVVAFSVLVGKHPGWISWAEPTLCGLRR